MHKITRAILGTVALAIGAAGTAAAADLPPPRVAPPIARAPVVVEPAYYNWTGFYIGGNGGFGWSHKCWTNLGTTSVPATAADEGCHDPSGALAGGQIGYNWQLGSWVLGLEAQGDWAHLKGDNISLLDLTHVHIVNRSRVDALGLLTGRLGFAANNVLVYVKGGGALASDKFDIWTNPSGAVIGSVSDTRWGWTAGGGLEFGFAQNWSIGAEYNYVDLSSQHQTFSPNAQVDDIKQNIHVVTGRINYRFGGGSRY